MDITFTNPSGLHNLIATLLVGLIVGFVANSLMGERSLGLIWSIILGLAGSVVGGFIFSLLGIGFGGLIGQILVGVIGACVVLYVARRLRRI